MLFCHKNYTLNSVTFQIYNASAGSGKTYTLVKEYMKILLGDEQVHRFKQVLAVTFTNKAVYEMKERVIAHLMAFSEEGVQERPPDMLLALAYELNVSVETLHQRAKKVLKYLLHNYAFFDIVTIDKFNHRIIRTFAHDLKLPSNFEVELDTGLLLEETVERLIYKAGTDELLTRALVDFALEKADEDKSWDIAFDLKKIAGLLLEENHYGHVEALKGKTLQDFTGLKQLLRTMIKTREKAIKAGAESVLKLIEANGLEASDFLRGMLPNHFKKMAALQFNGLYNNKLEENLSEGKLYAKTLPEEKATLIDELLPELSAAYQRLKKAVFQVKFLQNFYKNIVPLSLLNAIRNELESLKAEQNVVMISEFNRIISETIAHQPAPFIYERLGEKYRHYFIDEFQDTSGMQWENLQPLISNALESETLSGERGTLCLVGDAKQAIYRWRGGRPEQFIDLYREHNPFQVEKEVRDLPQNWRSFSKVVDFNNRFFNHIAAFLTHPDYRDLYRNKSFQEANDKEGGLVTLSFTDKEEGDESYCRQALQYIREAVAQGFAYNDICILTRRRSEGVQIAGYLLEQGIKIVSSETLLLKNNPGISFLIHLILCILHPHHKNYRLRVLHFLAEKLQAAEKHDFLERYIKDVEGLWSRYNFEEAAFLQLPFFDAVEYAIDAFELVGASDAYLQYFLDEVMDFEVREGGGPGDFIAWWEKKKDTLSIVAPQVPDAVQIMTIHKAKGLEFPVVIYPFANTGIYREQFPKLWFPVEEAEYGIPHALLNKNKDLCRMGEEAATLYDSFQSKLELDQFNILYVALTRAVERLYIITKKDLNLKREGKPEYFSGLFIDYLKSEGLWDDTRSVYTFGKPAPASSVKMLPTRLETIPFLSTPLAKERLKAVTRAGALWGASETASQEHLYRYVLSEITYASDLDRALKAASEAGLLPEREIEAFRNTLEAIINHPLLQPYYASPCIIYNERDIYTRTGEVVQPDRLAIHKNKVTIILYETGVSNPEMPLQFRKYDDIMAEMKLRVENKFLVRINDTVEVTAF